MRWAAWVLLAVGLSACGSNPAKKVPAGAAPITIQVREPVIKERNTLPAGAAVNACAPTREHRDSDYTPGGLYAPGVADGGPASPIDVSAVLEPIPKAEPRSRYGNRSPYSVLGKSYRVLDSAKGYHERGVASWYGTKFNGRATSSGELYDMCVFTAAHKTLPLPSFVRVTNLDNGRSLVVRVNDRGPFHSGRVMDLSYAAAVRLGVDRTGTARVELRAIGDGAAPAPAMAAAKQAKAGNFAALPAQTAQPVAASPAVIPDNAGTGSHRIVQVGSFGEQTNARRLADRLQKAGVDDVEVDHAEVGGRDVFRVRVGPVAMANLERLLDALRRLDLPTLRVISE